MTAVEPAQEPILVVEAGGTRLRAALFDPGTETLVRRRERRVESYVSAGGAGDDLEGRLADRIRELAEETVDGAPEGAVVVAYPGPVDGDGRVLASPTVAGTTSLQPLPLRSILAEAWPSADVVVMNEMTASGYRYLGEPVEDFCVVTVGSGIGHKLFLGGRPQLGSGWRGGEVGHLLVDLRSDAPVCDCGARGHIGGIASGRGVARLARTLAAGDGRGFSSSRLASDATFLECGVDEAGAILVAAVLDGDPWARGVVVEATSYLGIGIAALHVGVGVERVIVIGGFARALGETYREILAEAAASACWSLGQDWDEIVRLGAADDDHGLIGAGLYAVRRAAKG
jgi:glucokinase